MSAFAEKVKVLLGAVPVWGAVVQAGLTYVGASVVPNLPADVGLKVAAAVATVGAWVATAVAVVSRVTPVLFPQDRGLLVNTDEEFNAVFGSDEV